MSSYIHALRETMQSTNAYFYPRLIRNHMHLYVFPGGPDGQPDQKAIEAGLDNVSYCIKVVDDELADQSWLAGEAFSIANAFLCPMFKSLEMSPYAGEFFGSCKTVQRTGAYIKQRGSYHGALIPSPAESK